MAIDEVSLKHGHLANLDAGRFGVIDIDARDDHPLTVRLGVVADEEHRHTLRLGETFPVRDQTWKLDRVDNADKSDWTVVLTRVE
jgi:hypothetical protein